MTPDYSKYSDEELRQGIREDQERFEALTKEEWLSHPDSYWCKWPYAGAWLAGRMLVREQEEIMLEALKERTDDNN